MNMLLPNDRACPAEETLQAGLSFPIWVESPCPNSTHQPVTVGVPFPKGALSGSCPVTLTDPEGHGSDVQTEPLAWWSDGSVKWLLLDFVAGPSPAGSSRWELRTASRPAAPRRSVPLSVRESRDAIVVDTGGTLFHLDRRRFPLLKRVWDGRRNVLAPGSARLALKDMKGRDLLPRVDRVVVESRGPVRATVRTEGAFGDRSGCRFVARTCFFAGTALVRIRLTVLNPHRARHPGGLWDLGDRGSILFRGLSLELGLGGSDDPRVVRSAEAGQEPRTSDSGSLEIYQDSSGGDNWRSRNHVGRDGRQPCSFRGYRLRDGSFESHGLRASPVVSLQGAGCTLTAAVPEFWQQFPKSVGVNGRVLKVGLFPDQFGAPFELQGGEQKTHTVWLDFRSGGDPPGPLLEWVHRPALVRAAPEWYARSGALPEFGVVPDQPGPELTEAVEAALDSERGLVARREVIDEYGWRNYGDLYADHEAAYYPGPAPVVSHYNNQYDGVYGAILQYLRTGDPRWVEVFGPLARHVTDIDVYHTAEDRAAYNGGLFWHTDHYRDAATCTHRCYSRANLPADGRPNGGGPCSEHNYTTGLWHYHLLTGDPAARDTVVGLADWVIAMDDGSRTVLGRLDDGATGLASGTQTTDYQGPGRGGGNSINALLDAREATGRRGYLEYAEILIRRTVHPDTDISTLDLLDAGRRWSYTMYLSAVVRYLAVKAELGEIDPAYAFARASLLAFADWMLGHELPYFDRPGEMGYPTETWAAQELRKANVLRLSAAHADEPLRSDLLRRGDELADRAWEDLARFESRYVTRSLAIILVEGTRDAYLRAGAVRPAPRPAGGTDFGAPEAFCPQRRRVLARLRTARGLGRAVFKLAGIPGLPKFLAGRRP